MQKGAVPAQGAAPFSNAARIPGLPSAASFTLLED